MNSKELNKLLVTKIPSLQSDYLREKEWWQEEEPPSHCFFEDVFVPYIYQKLEHDNPEEIETIFDFIEDILTSNEGYACNVINVSVIETLYAERNENKNNVDKILNHMKKLTKKAWNEYAKSSYFK